MTQAKGVENDAVSTAPLAAPSDAIYRRIVESIGDYAIFMLDARGRVQTWTASAAEIQGSCGVRDHRRAFLALLYPRADRGGRPEHDLEQAESSGRFEDEGWRIRKDGSRFWANVSSAPCATTNGALSGFSNVTRDCTERRAHEMRFTRPSSAFER